MRVIHSAAALGFAALLAASAATAADNTDDTYGAATIGPTKRLPKGGRPWRKIPFPIIVNWNTLKIRLERSGCYGTCPAYRVELSADGTVRYDGEDYVAVAGKQETHVPVDRVRRLYEEFVKDEFFWTFNEYRTTVTDHPTYTVTISFDGHTKKVVDYVGLEAGMPEKIAALEDAIDDTAETRKWVKGNPGK